MDKMDMDKEVYIFKNMEKLAEYAIKIWEDVSREQLEIKGFFSAALSGGKTPVHFYEKLSEHKDLPWNKTHVFIVDERFVPYESDENNYHMINRILLRHVSIPPKNIHPILTTEANSQSSAERYEQDIRAYCKNTRAKMPKFDMVFLGIGEDGHTASLFPRMKVLKERDRFAVPVPSPEESGNERISLTLPIINNSSNIVFIVSGKSKAGIVKKVIEGEGNELPATMVRPAEGKLLFLLDEEAGSSLSKKGPDK